MCCATYAASATTQSSSLATTIYICSPSRTGAAASAAPTRWTIFWQPRIETRCSTGSSRDPLLTSRRLERAANAISWCMPEWSVGKTVELAVEVAASLRRDPNSVFQHMYGDEPDRWTEELSGPERLRFTINVLTRLRVCTAQGRVDLKLKGKPPAADSPFRPWFDLEGRLTRSARVVFGHWSALGFIQRAGVVGLDSGCVWGGGLTAFDLDAERPPVTLPCREYQSPGE